MEENKEKSELQREFELERVILFSDAVFAIAITLLVLDMKYEGSPTGKPASLPDLLKSLGRPFIAFVISFFFIGVQWSKHIEHMRYVRSYDKTFIALNLIFLFFIVTFPFSISFINKVGINQLPYFVVYFSNVVLCTMAFYALSIYIFKIKPSLCFPGNEAAKKLLLRKNLMIVIMILVLVVFLSIVMQIDDSKLQIALLAFAILSMRYVRGRVLAGAK